MKQIHLIHVVESSARYSWFERLFVYLNAQGFSQSLVTLQPRGEINDYLEKGPVNVFSQQSENRILSASGIVRLIRNARKKGSTNFLLLHGHKAAIVGLVAARTANLDFDVIHHVQPKYFQFLRSQKPLRGLIHQSIYRYYIRRATIIQSLSMEVTGHLLALGCDPKKIVSVGHGVDFEIFQKALSDESSDLSLKPGFPRILMVGRLAWEKNYPLAIEAFDQLRSSYPNAQLFIAGSGPLEHEFKSLVSKKGLLRNVTFLGWVKNIPKLMVNSDVLLHLAVTESYGQVYIEACLANLPIFSFPAGVAIDLSEAEDPLVHIIESELPENISNQIKDFLVGRKDNPNIVATPLGNYRRHDQTVVFQEMADYLSQLIPKLH